jgi:hypothetical protein
MSGQFFAWHVVDVEGAGELIRGATGPVAAELGGQTSTQTMAPAAAPDANADSVTEWLRGADARRFERRWVLLDDALNVVDSDPSPSALLDRHPDESTPLVVYVDPANSALAV